MILNILSSSSLLTITTNILKHMYVETSLCENGFHPHIYDNNNPSHCQDPSR